MLIKLEKNRKTDSRGVILDELNEFKWLKKRHYKWLKKGH